MMHIDEYISRGLLCNRYTREQAIYLNGGSEIFTISSVINSQAPVSDKIFVLFRKEFLTEEQMRSLAIEFALHACNYQFDVTDITNIHEYSQESIEYRCILCINTAINYTVEQLSSFPRMCISISRLCGIDEKLEFDWQLKRISECQA